MLKNKKLQTPQGSERNTITMEIKRHSNLSIYLVKKNQPKTWEENK